MKRREAIDKPPPGVPITEARDHWGELTQRVGRGRERVVLTRNGMPIAALVPLCDVKTLEWLERNHEDLSPGTRPRGSCPEVL
jgi:prevent-host-death family protein